MICKTICLNTRSLIVRVGVGLNDLTLDVKFARGPVNIRVCFKLFVTRRTSVPTI